MSVSSSAPASTMQDQTTTTMKALHYEGPFSVSVKSVGKPRIQHPDDVLVRVTTAGGYTRTPFFLFFWRGGTWNAKKGVSEGEGDMY